uniref:Alternative protein HUNK n=1 Tax=Homo sapiens TaxID=9606 RepID=L8E8I7_HUMAN|nr:alternative protein HUNK [Homo sapiens]
MSTTDQAVITTGISEVPAGTRSCIFKSFSKLCSFLNLMLFVPSTLEAGERQLSLGTLSFSVDFPSKQQTPG